MLLFKVGNVNIIVQVGVDCGVGCGLSSVESTVRVAAKCTQVIVSEY